MSRYNIEYNGKWACFSTISDLFVSPFKSKNGYSQWRLNEYGLVNLTPINQCAVATMEDAIGGASLNRSKREVIENLIWAGISESEAEELWNKYRLMPDKKDREGYIYSFPLDRSAID